MWRTKHKKYLFTQLTAPIAGFAGVFLLLSLAREVSPLQEHLNKGIGIVGIILICILFGLGLMGGMYLWGRILIILGVLTKEEGKGYPYSKPWERSKYR
ncbi:MAG: hypothetical protein ACFFCW_48675 [Candidatus Hodarchaeota archaeon]